MKQNLNRSKKLKSLKQIKQMLFKNQIKYILTNDAELFKKYGDDFTRFRAILFNTALYDCDPKQKGIIEGIGGRTALSRVYEYNHAAIMAAIQERLNNDYGFPSIKTISEDTNLSRPTIYKHLKNFDTSTHRTIEKQKIKIMADSVRVALYDMAVNQDNVQAAVAYLKYVEPRQATNEQKNYIQINNNFKVSEDVLKLLPQNKLIQIETLIRDSIKDEERVYNGLQIAEG